MCYIVYDVGGRGRPTIEVPNAVLAAIASCGTSQKFEAGSDSGHLRSWCLDFCLGDCPRDVVGEAGF